jgi:hypothetical protein
MSSDNAALSWECLLEFWEWYKTLLESIINVGEIDGVGEDNRNLTYNFSKQYANVRRLPSDLLAA